MARRIEHAVGDVAFVARVGGDEFVAVVLTDSGVGLDELSMRIRNAVLSLRVLEGIEINLDVSIGQARWRPGDTPEDLLRRADASMYEQKGNRK